MKSDRGIYTTTQRFHQENEKSKHQIKKLEDENTKLKLQYKNLINKLNAEAEKLNETK